MDEVQIQALIYDLALILTLGAAATIIGMEERKYEEFSDMDSKNNIQTDDKGGV